MAGYIVYEGPSRLDGKPIVCIVTGFDTMRNIAFDAINKSTN